MTLSLVERSTPLTSVCVRVRACVCKGKPRWFRSESLEESGLRRQVRPRVLKIAFASTDRRGAFHAPAPAVVESEFCVTQVTFSGAAGQASGASGATCGEPPSPRPMPLRALCVRGITSAWDVSESMGSSFGAAIDRCVQFRPQCV